MPRPDPRQRPRPRLAALVGALAEHEVRWVMTGSTVLAAYGADLVPNDLDVVPALDDANLRRLAELLERVGALPAYGPDWPQRPPLAVCLAWRPEPLTEKNLDHLFVTGLGMLDVPPRITGTYDELIGQATTVEVAGVPVRVCEPEQVLVRLPGTRRKDRERTAVYETVRQRLRHDRAPVGLADLAARLG
jgi:hypothetical protein